MLSLVEGHRMVQHLTTSTTVSVYKSNFHRTPHPLITAFHARPTYYAIADKSVAQMPVENYIPVLCTHTGLTANDISHYFLNQAHNYLKLTYCCWMNIYNSPLKEGGGDYLRVALAQVAS